MATVDITIMGAGVFGLSIAYVCARRGARVRVIDPGGVAAGASGGIVGALAPHVPENWNAKKAFQFDSLIMAKGFWQGVSELTGADVGYRRAGRLQPLADDRAVALAQARAENARTLWQGQAEWAVISAGDAPWMPPSPTGLVVHDTLSAHLHPRRATRALADAVIALGGEVVPDGRQAGRVLWANGVAGLAEIGGGGVKGQAALLGYDAGQVPQIFADALHFVPHADGTVAIGSTSEREYADPVGTDAALDEVLERARAALPVLGAAPVLARWAGVRPRSRSRAPVLGPHPARPGAFIANGGFKIGFGMAPEVAHVMADLLLEDQDRIVPEFRAEHPAQLRR